MNILGRTGRLLGSVGAMILLATLDALAQPVQPEHPEEAASISSELDEKFDKLGPLLSEIGEEAAVLVGGNPDGIFIYVEKVGDGAYPFLFKDRGKTVRAYMTSLKLQFLVDEVWHQESADPRMRWMAMTYEVRAHKFEVDFIYPETFEQDADPRARLLAALPARFAGKPITLDRALKESLEED